MTSELLRRLVETLNNEGIAYCHWKSNFYLRDALSGNGDLDLLVDRNQVHQFEALAGSLGFKRAIDPLQAPSPDVLHMYGLDNATGALIHLHVYYRVITGESLLKNYHLPVEELLLRDTRLVEGIPVPQPPAELITLVIRAMAKHTSLTEYLLLRRGGRAGYEALRAELEALLVDDNASRGAELLAEWLPPVEPALFAACIDTLRKDAPLVCRVRLAIRLRRQLRRYERFSQTSATFLRMTLLLRQVLRRLRGERTSKRFASGGAVIAFVGPEATGKSTLVRETARWLGKEFLVSAPHLGKPPSTWLTALPNLAVPLLRKVAPEHRTSRIKYGSGSQDARGPSPLYGLRSVLDAWDRRSLAIKVRRRAANGTIVICDRYPSATVGAMDSARLNAPSKDGLLGKALAHLARLEHQIYRQIPPPDVVFRLTVPVDVAIQRNNERRKKDKESSEYVLHRHMTGMVPVFPTATTVQLDSNQLRAQTTSSVRRTIWDEL